MEGPTLSLDASAEERREAYMWRARHAFVSVVNELAAARDAQTMAHYEWYFFTVPLLRHKVMLPSHLLEVQLWSELEPVLPDRKVGEGVEVPCFGSGFCRYQQCSKPAVIPLFAVTSVGASRLSSLCLLVVYIIARPPDERGIGLRCCVLFITAALAKQQDPT